MSISGYHAGRCTLRKQEELEDAVRVRQEVVTSKPATSEFDKEVRRFF